MSSQRILKVNQVVKELVAEGLADFKTSGLVTVMDVDTSPDMKHATVWLSFLESVTEQDLAQINELRREVQQRVAGKLNSRNVPRLEFQIDKSEQYADHINRILKGLQRP